MPIDYNDYPENWLSEIRPAILERAGNRCEGSPVYPECRALNGQPHPETISRVVLTIAHLDHDKTNSDPENLRAWCQRCHLKYDIKKHIHNRYENRRSAIPLLPGMEEVT